MSKIIISEVYKNISYNVRRLYDMINLQNQNSLMLIRVVKDRFTAKEHCPVTTKGRIKNSLSCHGQ